MIDDVFLFDGVAHLFNFDQKNAFGPPGQMFANHLYAFHQALTPDNEVHLVPAEFLRQWTVNDIRQMVYDESDTDMLVAMPLPLTDLSKEGLSPWEECAELAARDPDRTIFWGSVNPLEGRRALDLMERQVGPGVQVLQRPLRLRFALSVADGRPADRIPGLREGPGIGGEADRRAQRRPAGAAADRVHPDVGHGA